MPPFHVADSVDRHRPSFVRGSLGAVLIAVLLFAPLPAAGQYSMTAPSGVSIDFDRDRLLLMRERSVTLWDELQEDPEILYYTAYGRDLDDDDRSAAYPWNAIEVVTDSLAAVITPGNLREADRAYYNYVVLRMHAVREDPDVSCDVVFERELEAIDGFVDGWVIARTLFGGPEYEPLDEFAFAREEGVLSGMMAARSDRQLGGCLGVWRSANADAVAAYEEWREERYAAGRE
ncbi:MAG: hypothetical protein OEU54_09730 [Gemmatimonadota bacterium]|nr:hypothetical protein [Gemmatimonadota bacterium]